MKKMMRKAIAKIRGTFVADCARCHSHYYGFHDHATQVKFDNKHYRIVCHRCALEFKSKEEHKLLK